MAIDSALYNDLIKETVITTMENRLAPLMALSTDFSDGEVQQEGKRSTTITVGLTSGGTVAKNPTDYETSPGLTIDPVAITLDEFFLPWSIASNVYNKSSLAKLEKVVADNTAKFADSIWAEVATLFSLANFGDLPPLDVALANFDADAIKTLRGRIAKGVSKFLILDSTYYAKAMPSNKDGFMLQGGAYGFNGIYEASDFSDASDDIIGVACDPRCIAAGTRLPFLQSEVQEKMSMIESIEIPSLGMTVQMCRWGTTKTREAYMSLGVYFGASVGRSDALVPVTNGGS